MNYQISESASLRIGVGREMVGSKQVYEALCGVISGKGGGPGWSGWVEEHWLALASLAQVQGVAPLAYWAFRQAGWPEGMDPKARAKLAQAYYSNAGHYELLLGELRRLLERFEQETTPVVVLKGMALASEAYPEPALRPMNDIDLLVPAVHLRGALRVMNSCGYILHKVTNHAVYMGGPRHQVRVEVHWSLIHPPEKPQKEAYLQSLWAKAKPWAGDLGVALTLSLEDQLLYLSAHLAYQHPGELSRLVWFYDIHLLVECFQERIDWLELLDQAMKLGWEDALFYTLDGCCKHLGTRLPERFLEELKHQIDESANQRNGDSLDQSPPSTPMGRKHWMQEWMWEALREVDWRLRLRITWGLLWPHPDYMRWRYKPTPAWLWPATYPLRWWLLVWDWLAPRLKPIKE